MDNLRCNSSRCAKFAIGVPGAIVRRDRRISVVDNNHAAWRKHVMDPRENACDRAVLINIEKAKRYGCKFSVVELLGICLDYVSIAYAVRN